MVLKLAWFSRRKKVWLISSVAPDWKTWLIRVNRQLSDHLHIKITQFLNLHSTTSGRFRIYKFYAKIATILQLRKYISHFFSWENRFLFNNLITKLRTWSFSFRNQQDIIWKPNHMNIEEAHYMVSQRHA